MLYLWVLAKGRERLCVQVGDVEAAALLQCIVKLDAVARLREALLLAAPAQVRAPLFGLQCIVKLDAVARLREALLLAAPAQVRAPAPLLVTTAHAFHY